MLEKKAKLGVAKDEQGLVLVDQNTGKGARIPDETMLQLTLAVWELCDKSEPPEIVKKLIGPNKVTDEQKGAIEKVVDSSLKFFIQAEWAAEKKKPAKKK